MRGFHAVFYRTGRSMLIDPRAHGSHGLPIAKIHLQILNVGPITAHFWFHGMDRTTILVKNAEAIFALGQHQLIARFLAKSFPQIMWRDINVGGDAPNVRIADICSAITLAAIPALSAGKNSVICFAIGFAWLRAHDGSPWHVAG